MARLTRLAVISVSLCLFSLCSLGSDNKIGVYYYPGWSPYINGPHVPDSWSVIKPFSERKPSLGWYDDSRVETLDRQLLLMHKYGIDFIAFDWYWGNGKPARETSVRAYLKAPSRNNVRYTLLWANHGRYPRSIAEWDSLVDFWVSQHMANPEYLRIDEKPVLIVFSGDDLKRQSAAAGLDVQELLDRARNRAIAAGLRGIYFVLCAPAVNYWIKDFAPKAGFDAVTAYNYHFGVTGEMSSRTPDSRSFKELDDGYRAQWRWILENSKLPYFLPMTTGWDKRPWGGSENREHDNSESSPSMFHAHISAAKALMDQRQEKNMRIGLICCWNEFGEGSYLEPTDMYGTKYLEAVLDVFKKKKK